MGGQFEPMMMAVMTSDARHGTSGWAIKDVETKNSWKNHHKNLLKSYGLDILTNNKPFIRKLSIHPCSWPGSWWPMNPCNNLIKWNMGNKSCYKRAVKERLDQKAVVYQKNHSRSHLMINLDKYLLIIFFILFIKYLFKYC